MTIINLTQHAATPIQIADGVFEPSNKREIQSLLTFEGLPSAYEVNKRARIIACHVPEGTKRAMIGGAPYLMAPLEFALLELGITPLYSFNTRQSVETLDPVTQVVTKTAQFVHSGWVEVQGNFYKGL